MVYCCTWPCTAVVVLHSLCGDGPASAGAEVVDGAHRVGLQRDGRASRGDAHHGPPGHALLGEEGL